MSKGSYMLRDRARYGADGRLEARAWLRACPRWRVRSARQRQTILKPAPQRQTTEDACQAIYRAEASQSCEGSIGVQSS